MEKKKDFDYILVSGFGWSGSSALVDLLKEYDDVWGPDIEFRLVRDPYGVSDLYHNVVETRSTANADNAIRDFLWHTEHAVTDLAYDRFVGPHFTAATQHFVDKLVTFKYDSWWWFQDFKDERADVKLSQIIRTKLRRRLDKRYGIKLPKLDREKFTYFSDISREDFLRFAQEYIDEMFTPPQRRESARHILLDNAVVPNDFRAQLPFFRDGKFIIVNRDPRDMCADVVKNAPNISLGKDITTSGDASKYIKMYHFNHLRLAELKQAPNVLYLDFTELIFRYDETVAKIEKFLSLDPTKHVRKKQYFDPAVSRKNVGMWKGILTDKVRTELETELSGYLMPESD